MITIKQIESPAVVTDGLTDVNLYAGQTYTCEGTTKSGIAYQRVTRGELISYVVGDAAYVSANNIPPAPPEFPTHTAELDTTALVPFLTLKQNNAFGNLNRFTNDLGGSTFDGSGGETINYVVDNLTGQGVWLPTINLGLNWTLSVPSIYNSGAYGGFNDWWFGSVRDLQGIADTGIASGWLNYTPFYSTTSYSSSTTYATNTGQQVWTRANQTISAINKANVLGTIKAFRYHF